MAKRKPLHTTEDTASGRFFFVGAFLGALIGALWALWNAPRSGRETRLLIQEQAEQTRRQIEGESIHEAIEAGKAEARRLNRTDD